MQQINLFSTICPICGDMTIPLLGMRFKEGVICICEPCRLHNELADVYVPPMFESFKERVLSK